MKRPLWLLALLVVLLVGGYATWLATRADPIGHLPRWVQLRPSIYLKTALDRIESHAYGRDAVDWSTLRSRAADMAANATTPDGTYPALRATLAALPDHESLLLDPPDPATAGKGYGLQVLFPDRTVAIVYPGSAAAAAGIHPGDVVEAVEGHPPMANRDARVRGHFIDIPPPSTSLHLRPVTGAARDVTLATSTFALLPADTHRIGDDLGYVLLPATPGGAPFVQAVQDGIVKVDGPAVCGWMVDLRLASGGSLLPMLEALRAVLGEAPIGSSVDATGTRTFWAYPPSTRVLAPLTHAVPPVAVLTSRLTAGAGEGVLVAFRGRQGVRTFGESTWGTPATTTNVPLPDGAVLQLTQAFDADRTGEVYRERIVPDETVPVAWARLGAPDDAVIVAAGTWLRTQCHK